MALGFSFKNPSHPYPVPILPIHPSPTPFFPPPPSGGSKLAREQKSIVEVMWLAWEEMTPLPTFPRDYSYLLSRCCH